MSGESPTLATEDGRAALNLGLDSMVQAHSVSDPKGDLVAPEVEQQLTQLLFSPNEIAALLTLAVRRLARIA